MHITRRSQLYGLGAEHDSGNVASAGGNIARALIAATGAAGGVVASQIRGVTIRSQFTPDIRLTGRQALGQDATTGGMGELFMQITKPALYVDTSLGTMRIAPWGEPSMNLYPVFVIGTLVGLGALAGLIARGLKK